MDYKLNKKVLFMQPCQGGKPLEELALAQVFGKQMPGKQKTKNNRAG